MRRLSATIAVVAILFGASSCLSEAKQSVGTQAATNGVRVGTYDSRLVATAYVRSDAFKQRLDELRAELERAKATGDQERVAQLEAEGPAMQAMIHKQGFGTSPIHDILQTIEDEIPSIAREAQVDLIVSKWELVYQRPWVELTDVTDLMVAPFDPTEDTRKVLESLRGQDPVPLDDLKAVH